MQYNIETKEYGAYDVAVCGGGTAGVFAAIAAARGGAKVILIERTFTVGGMITLGDGGLTKFSEHCKDVDKYKTEVLDVLAADPKKVQIVGGIPLEFVHRLLKDGNALGTHGTAGSYIFTDRIQAQWALIDMLNEAGVEVLYDTRVCLVCKDGDKITGVVFCNKDGFSHINAAYVIDATGDADVSALAGVPYNVGATEDDVKEGGAVEVGQLQGAGCMYRVRNVDFQKLFKWLKENPDRFHRHEFGVMSLDNVIESYNNGEMCVFRFLVTTDDETDCPVQVYNLPEKDEAILLGLYTGIQNINGCNARELSEGQDELQLNVRKTINCLREHIPGFENITALFVPDIGIRETRHIIADYKLTTLDVLLGNDFEDSIGCGGHPADIHPLPPEIENMDMNHWRFHIPYRIMVPQKVENLLVAGRSACASRVAVGAIRPTAQCMVMGEAAGTAAAIALKDKTTCRNVDIKKLRATLLENGAVI